MTWEPRNDQFDEINELGKRLSLEINCTVRWPAYDKNLFECKCGVIFPKFMLMGNQWEAVKEKHKEVKK